MKSRHSLTIATVLGFIALLSIGFTVQQRVTTTAFDNLESKEVSEHAERVRVALEYEMQLLRNYGATNSIWDNSYNDVANADEAGLESDFVPGDLKSIYGLDGVVGVFAGRQSHDRWLVGWFGIQNRFLVNLPIKQSSKLSLTTTQMQARVNVG